MMLKQTLDSLPTKKRFELVIKLIRLWLPVWATYAKHNALEYKDSVVGLTHKVNEKLLRETVDSVEKYLNLNAIQKFFNGKQSLMRVHCKFDDPIVALQDGDLELPNEIESGFYAVYNLIESALGETKTVFKESTLEVCINQAIEALESSGTLTKQAIMNIVQASHSR